MQNIEIMETLEAECDVDESFPDSFLIECCIVLLVCDYFLVKVTVIQKLHDYAAL